PDASDARSGSARGSLRAARADSATGITSCVAASAVASLALPTTASWPSARADASAAVIAVTAGVTNRPTSTRPAILLLAVAQVVAARRLDLRRDPRDVEQLVEQHAKIIVGHDEEIHLAALDAAAGIVGAHAAVVDRAVREHQAVELRNVERLAEPDHARVDRDRLERDQRAQASAAAGREGVGLELLEAGAVAELARPGVIDDPAVAHQARALELERAGIALGDAAEEESVLGVELDPAVRRQRAPARARHGERHGVLVVGLERQ